MTRPAAAGKTLRMRRGAITIICAATLAAAAPAQAPGLDNDRARLITAKAAAAQAEARAAALQAASARAGDEAARARAKAAALALRVAAAEQDIAAAHARIALVRTLERAERRRIAERQGPILRLVAALQTMARRPAALAVAQPGSVDDLVHVRLLLADMQPVVARRTAAVRIELARATRLRRDAERAADALAAGRVLLARRRQALAAVESGAQARSRAFADRAGDEAQRALGLGEDARDIADRLQVQQDTGQVLARLASVAPPEPRPGGGDAAAVPAHAGAPRYRLPAAGAVATGFGEVAASGVRSRGLALTPAGDGAVVAPAHATVLFARPFRSYGGTVILAHGGGWTTTVTGLGTIAVRAGDVVAQGDAIGRAGSRAPVTAELRRGGRAIDIVAVAQAG